MKGGDRIHRRRRRWPGSLGIFWLSVACLACGEVGRPGARPAPVDLDAGELREALLEALATTDTFDRVARTVELLAAVDDDNVAGARAAYDQRLAHVDRSEIRLYANTLARRGPREALDEVMRWEYPGLKRAAVSEIVYWWARHGGSAEARAYAEATLEDAALGEKTVRNVMIDALVRAVAASGDHAELTEIFASLPADDTREWLLTQSILELYRTGGFAATKAWVDSIPWDVGDGLAFSALKRGLHLQSKALGADSAAWYLEFEPRLSPDEVEEALPLVVQGWVRRDPEATIAWLRDRPQSAVRDEALRSAAIVWLKGDPETAVAWIEARLEDPLVERTLLFPLAQYTMSIDIHEALPLAERIPIEGERIRALKQILVMWSRDDYAAVEAYMAENDVPEAVVAAVRGQRAIRTQRRRDPSAEGQGS